MPKPKSSPRSKPSTGLWQILAGVEAKARGVGRTLFEGFQFVLEDALEELAQRFAKAK